VSFLGADITRVPAEVLVGRGLVMVPGGKAMFADLTVTESLEIGARLVPKPLRRQRIERELHRFPCLAERRGSLSGSLSGGEQQQLAIAKALLLDPTLLCIDELSLGLAPVVVEGLLQTVRDVRDAGTTVVVVEQSLNIAAALCDRAVFLEKGTVRFEGLPRELLDRGDIARSVFLGADRRTG
jgi:ABC-type branched-subunit amino acid transport system ATPase component